MLIQSRNQFLNILASDIYCIFNNLKVIQCIDPFRTFPEGRKSGAKWVDGAKWVEMVRNGSISGIQNFSNEKRSISTDIN